MLTEIGQQKKLIVATFTGFVEPYARQLRPFFTRQEMTCLVVSSVNVPWQFGYQYK